MQVVELSCMKAPFLAQNVAPVVPTRSFRYDRLLAYLRRPRSIEKAYLSAGAIISGCLFGSIGAALLIQVDRDSKEMLDPAKVKAIKCLAGSVVFICLCFIGVGVGIAVHTCRQAIKRAHTEEAEALLIG
jgi:hypothetical protein